MAINTLKIKRKIILGGLWLIGFTGCSTAIVSVSESTYSKSGVTDLKSVEIKVGLLKREYKYYLPKSYDPNKPMPAVFLFHGGGGTAEAALIETGMNKKADEAGFILVLPEGIRSDMSKKANFRKNPQTWNDGSGRFFAGENHIDDIEFVSILLDDVEKKLSVDKKRIYASGFSNGSSFVYRLGIELASKFAAIAPIASSGLRMKDIKLPLSRAVPLLAIQGSEDPRNPLAGGNIKNFGVVDPRPPIRSSIERWSNFLACSGSQITEEKAGVKKEIFYGCKNNSEIVFYIIEGMGHTWPGGKALLPKFLVGETTSLISANDIIWDFFKKYSLP